MTDDDVNKAIGKFMGYDVIRCLPQYDDMPTACRKNIKQYTKSLDALVPVWKKLGGEHIQLWSNICESTVGTNEKHEGFGETIQQAAAHATYKCILELDSES